MTSLVGGKGHPPPSLYERALHKFTWVTKVYNCLINYLMHGMPIFSSTFIESIYVHIGQVKHASVNNVDNDDDVHPICHLSLNLEGRWRNTGDFETSFLHFSLFFTANLDLTHSRPVHSLMLSSHLLLCLPCLLPPFTVPCKMVLPDLMKERHDHITAVCVSLRCSGGLRVVQLPAGSWHGLSRW